MKRFARGDALVAHRRRGQRDPRSRGPAQLSPRKRAREPSDGPRTHVEQAVECPAQADGIERAITVDDERGVVAGAGAPPARVLCHEHEVGAADRQTAKVPAENCYETAARRQMYVASARGDFTFRSSRSSSGIQKPNSVSMKSRTFRRPIESTPAVSKSSSGPSGRVRAMIVVLTKSVSVAATRSASSSPIEDGIGRRPYRPTLPAVNTLGAGGADRGDREVGKRIADGDDVRQHVDVND